MSNPLNLKIELHNSVPGCTPLVEGDAFTLLWGGWQRFRRASKKHTPCLLRIGMISGALIYGFIWCTHLAGPVFIVDDEKEFMSIVMGISNIT